MLEKLASALEKLSADELLLIDMLYTQLKTEREISQITGVPQTTICYRKKRLLGKLKKFLENKKFFAQNRKGSSLYNGEGENKHFSLDEP